MRRFCLCLLLLTLAVAGCAHNSPVPVASRIVPAQPEMQQSQQQPQPAAAVPSLPAGEVRERSPDPQSPFETRKVLELAAQEGEQDEDEEGAGVEEGEAKQATPIADPLEKFNRAMFTFNDKLYYWVLKPVAQGYAKVVPETPRVSVSNFFNNLGFPVRFLSMLLQADFSGAAAALGRFTVNTVWGIGGLMDPASTKQLEIPKKDADLGQTLGFYGLGQGFYIVWPFLGPSSARDSVNIPGDYFLHPSILLLWYEWLPLRTYGVVNDTSLRIGDYEALTEAAIDPYIGMRDAYVQYRRSKVESARGKTEPARPPAGVRVGQLEYPSFIVMRSLALPGAH
jgi:phospholipid-binding lipoprotein MlaA